jgi:hypothetical protein
MKRIQEIMSQHFKGQISTEVAEAKLSRLRPDVLAEFIMSAKNRGWISNFNLGLNDEGDLI